MNTQPFGQRLLDAVARPCFGRDLFIAYSRRDQAMGYALRLAAEVRKAAAELDDPLDVSISNDLWAGGPSAVTHPDLVADARRSQAFVLIATSGAVRSPEVEREVKARLSTGQYILTIDVDKSMKRARWKQPGLVDTVETMPLGEISGEAFEKREIDPAIVARVLEAIRFNTQTRRIRRIVRNLAFAGAAVVIGAYGFSAWQIRKANDLRDTAKVAAVHARFGEFIAAVRRSIAEWRSSMAEDFAVVEQGQKLRAEADTKVARLLETEAKSAAAREQEIAIGWRFAADASILRRHQPEEVERAAHLAKEAMQRLSRHGIRAFAADTVLRDALPRLAIVKVRRRLHSGDAVASPDGRYLAEIRRSEIVLCQTSGGHCTTIPLNDATAAVQAVTFSGDGNVLAVANDLEVLVFRTTGDPLRHLSFDGRVDRISLSEDGTVIAAATGATLLIHDAAAGTTVERPVDLDAQIGGIALSHDGRLLVTIEEGKAVVWNWATAKARVVLPARGDVVYATFAPGDSRIATIDTKQGLVVSDWPDVNTSWTGTLAPPLQIARFSADGRWIAASRLLGAGVHVYDAASGRLSRAINEPARSVAFSRDGSTLATGSSGSAALWRATDGQELGRTGHAGVADVVFRDDGSIVSFDREHELKVWIPNPLFRSETPVATTGIPWKVAFEPSAGFLLLATRPTPFESGGTYRIDRNGKSAECRQLSGEGISSLVFASDGALVTGSTSGKVRLWKTWCDESSQGAMIADTGKPVDALAVSGSRIAIASGDALLMIDHWREPSRRLFTVPAVGRSRSIAFTSRGAVVAGGSSGVVRVWPWNRSRPAGELKTVGDVTEIATSGELVVSGGREGATIWNRTDGSTHVLRHPRLVWSVAFDPTGKYLMTAGADQMAHVWANWDSNSAEEIARVSLSDNIRSEESHGVRLAAFSGDGRWLAVVTQRPNPYVSITPWQPEEMIDAAERSLLALR